MKNKIPFLTSILATCLIATVTTIFTGCKSSADLQAGGDYAPGITSVTTNADGSIATNFVATGAPDIQFFEADDSYALAYATIDAAFTYEAQNRAALWQISPQIKHTMDSIRPQAWQADVDWAHARAAYIADPIPANLTAMQTLLAQSQSIAAAVTAALNTNPTTNSIPYACCLVPGIIMYVLVIKKLRRFQNIVVTTTPMNKGTEVVVTYPSHAKKLAGRFLNALPELP